MSAGLSNTAISVHASRYGVKQKRFWCSCHASCCVEKRAKQPPGHANYADFNSWWPEQPDHAGEDQQDRLETEFWRCTRKLPELAGCQSALQAAGGSGVWMPRSFVHSSYLSR